MKINDLIFGELLKRRFSVIDGTRVWDLADSKLWYLTPEQSKDFIALEHSNEYNETITQEENNLIKKHLSDLLSELAGKYYNIIDLGCGDGVKASILIQGLREKLDIRYCPIDISAFMVREAIKTIKSVGLDQIIKFKWNVSDFENLENVVPLLQEPPFEQNVFLLLGNTFGNFDCNAITHSISQSMLANDYLLVGNSLIVDENGDPSNSYNDRMVSDFLVKVLEQIGLSEEDVTYGTKFANSRVECFFKLNADKEIDYLGKRLSFKAGDIILVAYSYRYQQKDFEEAFTKFFPSCRFFYNDSKSYGLALCEK